MYNSERVVGGGDACGGMGMGMGMGDGGCGEWDGVCVRWVGRSVDGGECLMGELRGLRLVGWGVCMAKAHYMARCVER